MNNKFILMTVLFCGGIAHAMENVENNGLIAVQKWQDAIPFAGKVVAYAARTYWLNNNGYKCMLPSSHLNYAYIKQSDCKWSDPGKQLIVLQLLKAGSPQSNVKVLDKDTLDNEDLKMRNITFQEAKEVIEALTVKNASFACVHFSEERDLISQLRLIAANKV
jgi:hypothetical protein